MDLKKLEEAGNLAGVLRMLERAKQGRLTVMGFQASDAGVILTFEGEDPDPVGRTIERMMAAAVTRALEDQIAYVEGNITRITREAMQE